MRCLSTTCSYFFSTTCGYFAGGVDYMKVGTASPSYIHSPP
jgi:hypothetical protein